MAQGTSFGGFGFGLHGRAQHNSRLILEAQQDETVAFLEAVQNYESPVMRVALALTGSEDSAREIYCHVFADAFASIDQMETGASGFIWLYQILVKHCLEFCRRGRRIDPACVAADPSPGLARVLGMLPPRERVVFALKHVQQLKVRTLAEIFMSPPEYIEEVLRKGARRLQMSLALRVLLQG